MSHMKNRDSNKRRREDRQVQAKVRQESYDKLTVAEKIAQLPADGAKKQKAKLYAQLTAKLGAAMQHPTTVEVKVEAPKAKKGAKAKRQAKHDKKGKE